MLPWLGVHLGVDGLSVLFLPLTALLTLFVIPTPSRTDRNGPAFVGNKRAGAGSGVDVYCLEFAVWLSALPGSSPATGVGIMPTRPMAVWRCCLESCRNPAGLMVFVRPAGQGHFEAAF